MGIWIGAAEPPLCPQSSVRALVLSAQHWDSALDPTAPSPTSLPPALPPCAGRRPLRALVPLRWVFTAEASNCICCASLALPRGLTLLLRLLLELCLCRFYRLPELPLLQALVVGKHRACDFGNREHEREALGLLGPDQANDVLALGAPRASAVSTWVALLALRPPSVVRADAGAAALLARRPRSFVRADLGAVLTLQPVHPLMLPAPPRPELWHPTQRLIVARHLAQICPQSGGCRVVFATAHTRELRRRARRSALWAPAQACCRVSRFSPARSPT